MGLHINPPAPWLTPEAFGPGGHIEERTAHLLRTHGARCLEMWRASVARFAAGRDVTTGIVEAHNRQSLDHWAFGVAAALVLADGRHLTKPEIAGKKTGKDVRRAFGWGRR